MSSHDAYRRVSKLTSIDVMSEEVLHHLVQVRDLDVSLERKRDALEFAAEFLTQTEIEFVFFKYFLGNSHKTLKKTLGIGSFNTIALRTRTTKAAIKAYVQYKLEAVFEDDLLLIEQNLGSDGRIIAEQLFRRKSKKYIKQSDLITICSIRLSRTVDDLLILCAEKLQLQPFRRVLHSIGKLPQKK